MSIKRIREKLEMVDLKVNDVPPVAFLMKGKYYTDPSYSEEIDKFIVEKHKLVVIHFGKP